MKTAQSQARRDQRTASNRAEKNGYDILSRIAGNSCLLSDYTLIPADHRRFYGISTQNGSIPTYINTAGRTVGYLDDCKVVAVLRDRMNYDVAVFFVREDCTFTDAYAIGTKGDEFAMRHLPHVEMGQFRPVRD